MEYPMICFNGPRPEKDGTYSARTKYSLISVIIHEVGHLPRTEGVQLGFGSLKTNFATSDGPQCAVGVVKQIEMLNCRAKIEKRMC